MAEVLGTGFQRSGKLSRITIDDTPLAKANWDVTYEGIDLDTVNFESLGIDEGIVGILSAKWNLGGDWDASFNAFDDPPGLFPRDDLEDLAFFENVTDDVAWVFPLARVRSAMNGADVRQKVSFRASGLNQGIWSLPTGSAG